jgi:hypothetical protein
MTTDTHQTSGPGANTVRILVVTDHPQPSHALLNAMRLRAARGRVQFRVVVPNPARAELHLLHPERHTLASEAEGILRQALPALEVAAGGDVIGSVTVFHDPMDAIEHTLQAEPVDEIVLAIVQRGWAVRLHQDLPHRLRHLGLPLTIVDEPTRP